MISQLVVGKSDQGRITASDAHSTGEDTGRGAPRRSHESEIRLLLDNAIQANLRWITKPIAEALDTEQEQACEAAVLSAPAPKVAGAPNVWHIQRLIDDKDWFSVNPDVPAIRENLEQELDVPLIVGRGIALPDNHASAFSAPLSRPRLVRPAKHEGKILGGFFAHSVKGFVKKALAIEPEVVPTEAVNAVRSGKFYLSPSSVGQPEVIETELPRQNWLVMSTEPGSGGYDVVPLCEARPPSCIVLWDRVELRQVERDRGGSRKSAVICGGVHQVHQGALLSAAQILQATSAVVVTYNSKDHLPSCLRAARRIPALVDVVVVDHGHDGSADLAASLGAEVIRDPSNPGFGAGQNHGVARTATDYVLLLNPDAFIEPNGIEKGFALLETVPDVAAVQGVIRNAVTGQPERSQGVALGPVHLIGRALGLRRLLRFGIVRRVLRRAPIVADHVGRTPDGPAYVESLGATALLVRRKAFDEVGGFDEGFFLYGEDLDLCRRLREAGWRLVALPVHWADHAQGASSSGWWARELVWWEGTLRYAAKWWSAPAWAGARVATGLRILPMIAAQPKRTPEVLARLVISPGRVRRSY